MRKFAAVLLLVVGFAAVAAAREPVAPEIDPGSVMTAAALVGSALLMVRRRVKR